MINRTESARRKAVCGAAASLPPGSFIKDGVADSGRTLDLTGNKGDSRADRLREVRWLDIAFLFVCEDGFETIGVFANTRRGR
jgi:hypothetical protein